MINEAEASRNQSMFAMGFSQLTFGWLSAPVQKSTQERSVAAQRRQSMRASKSEPCSALMSAKVEDQIRGGSMSRLEGHQRFQPKTITFTALPVIHARDGLPALRTVSAPKKLLSPPSSTADETKVEMECANQ
eukprot:CAMPEP_0196730440 /NCGR_PEP_ID=MMETSP1091-20130531/10488_1 /TAXON_ID=302021 /ORGANISM="Rhodomonas sp., Strain CCMP768" /LENGTH=132 /DNA_ID=CAMNT_0042073435 /DNA_START=83 /DNA_END=482 /DNA_ORIENTATION=+